MSSPLQFHAIDPDSIRDSYASNDLVTFSVSVGDGRALMPGSVRLEGLLSITAGGQRVSNEDVRLDNYLGANALFAELNTEAVNLGVIEQSGASYARAARQISDLTKRPTDFFTGTAVAALQSPDVLLTQDYVRGVQPVGQTGDPDAIDFSIAPTIALNRASGAIAFSRTGQIRVTVRLATVQDALFGGEVDANTSYTITNFRLTCHSVPDSMAPKTVSMRSFSSAESTVQSASASISTRLPAICSSVTVSALPVAKRGSYVYNTAESERIVGLQEMVLMLNDTISGRITQPLDDEAEVLRLAIASVSAGPEAHNSVTPQHLAALHKWHVGYPLGTPVDLSRTPFTLQLTTDGSVSNANPWVITIIGHSIFTI
jgi:hypothetical protein